MSSFVLNGEVLHVKQNNAISSALYANIKFKEITKQVNKYPTDTPEAPHIE